MTPRCEPPEELRGEDGWYWVEPPRGMDALPMAWTTNRDNHEREWLTSTGKFVSAGSQRAAGWRCLGPCATPAEVDALRAEIAGKDAIFAEHVLITNGEYQRLRTLRARVVELEESLRVVVSWELTEESYSNLGFDAGYVRDAFKTARAALNGAKP